MICTGATCPGPIPTFSNVRYVTLQGDAATSSAPAIGTVLAVTCSAGYEQTRGLPYYACQGDDDQSASWSGQLLDPLLSPVCQGKSLARQLFTFLKPDTGRFSSEANT